MHSKQTTVQSAVLSKQQHEHKLWNILQDILTIQISNINNSSVQKTYKPRNLTTNHYWTHLQNIYCSIQQVQHLPMKHHGPIPDTLHYPLLDICVLTRIILRTIDVGRVKTHNRYMYFKLIIHTNMRFFHALKIN